MPQDVARRLEEKIEEKIDRVAAGNTEVSMQLGGVKFQTMIEVMEFAKLMAVSQCAVPPHLRNNPGACLAICTRALRFGFDPFALAEHSYEMKKMMDVTIESPNGGRVTKKEEVSTIAYDSYVVRAVIEAHAPIKGRLKYTFVGEGEERKCTASAVLRETDEVISIESPTLGARLKAIGKNDRGHIKGSPLWENKPDQQLSYDTGRDLCRRHFPEILMGWYDKDEIEEAARAEMATDVTPKPDIGSRLKGGKGRRADKPAAGFQAGHTEKTIADAASSNTGGPDLPASADPQSQKGAESNPAPVSAAGTEIGSGGETSHPHGEKIGADREAALPAAADPANETPLQRGTRLLGICKRADIQDLMDSIADELSGTERDVWKSACQARMAALA